MGLKQRNDTTANWTSVNPVLEVAERGYDRTLGKWKTGDGVTAWLSLAFDTTTGAYTPGGTDVAVADGGTGSSTASAARTALGLAIGTDVLAPSGSGAALTGITESQITNLTTDLAAKAPLASPTFTGTPAAPTATAGISTTQLATTAFVSAKMLGLFGDGSDGAVNFDGTTATSAGVFTRTGSGAGAVYQLQRDVYFTTSHVSNSCHIDLNSFRLFCTGTLTVDASCVVRGDGPDAVLATAGSGASTGTLGRSGSGGSGGTTGVGGTPSAQANTIGAAGGAGGAGNSTLGGAAGTGTALATSSGLPRNMLQAISQLFCDGTGLFKGALGGGGGGGSATGTGTSGGGGAGGFTAVIVALLVVNNGTIRANGGAGAAAVLGTAAGRGGGGGGGGGALFIISTSAANGTRQVNGGGAGAGAGSGATGSAGSAGTFNEWFLV